MCSNRTYIVCQDEKFMPLSKWMKKPHSVNREAKSNGKIDMVRENKETRRMRRRERAMQKDKSTEHTNHCNHYQK